MKKLDIILRPEQPQDYYETENVTREAFWNEHAPGCNEHYLLHIMRENSAFLPELDIIAVDIENSNILGNIVYVKSLIKADNGSEHEVLCLGPISVLPKYQRKGIGSRMIEHTLKVARDINFRAVFLYGDPVYYSRHGFKAAEGFGIRTSDNMYADALQVYELFDGALSDIKGRFFENEIYEIDEKSAEEFDKSFPAKEKITGTASQKRFLEVVAMRKKAN